MGRGKMNLTSKIISEVDLNCQPIQGISRIGHSLAERACKKHAICIESLFVLMGAAMPP